MIDASVVLGDPADGPDRRGRARRGASAARRPARGRRRDGRAGRAHPGHADVGAGRSGPARAVRQRGRGRHPQCPAVRPGRGAERPAARARRGQGRLPAGRQPQPPDAIDQHPRLRGAARAGSARSTTRDHRRAVAAPVAHGPPAADRDPARVGRAPSALRGGRPGRPVFARPGRRSAPPTCRFSVDDRAPGLAGVGRRRPARPGPLGAARQRRQVRRPDRRVGRDRRGRARVAPARHDRRRGPRRRPRTTGRGSSGASSGAPSEAPTRAAGSGCTCRASCAGRWAATSSSNRRRPVAARRSRVYLPAESAEEG